MTAFEWDDSFLVGVRQVDQHNEYLFKLIGSLYKRLIEHSDLQTTKSEFHELSDYIIFHFASEEIWMVRSKYCIITGHQEQHNQLRLLLLNIHSLFQNGDVSVVTMLQSLIKSVTAHIKKSDASYGHYVHDKISGSINH